MSPPRRGQPPTTISIFCCVSAAGVCTDGRNPHSGSYSSLARSFSSAWLSPAPPRPLFASSGPPCDLADLKPVTIGQNSFVYAADGSLLGAIPAERNRQADSPSPRMSHLVADGDGRDRGQPLLRTRRSRPARVSHVPCGRTSRRGSSCRAARRSPSSSYGTCTSRASAPSAESSRKRVSRSSLNQNGRSGRS